MLSPDELLKRCNEFRLAGGAEPLEALLPGYVGKPFSCLIAVNLNFDCAVAGISAPKAAIYSDDSRLPQVAATLDLEPITEQVLFPRMMKFGYRLPKDLTESARAFDEGRYPDDLYGD